MKNIFEKLKTFALHTGAGKLTLAFIAVILVGLPGFKATEAYLAASAEHTENAAYAAVSCAPVGFENRADISRLDNIEIKNTGNVKSYVRAALLITWADDQGSVYGTKPSNELDYYYKIVMGKNGWFQKGNYYIYESPLEPNAATSAFIESFERSKQMPPAGYHLNLEVMCEAIQAEPAEAVTDAWGVTVDTQTGKITV